MSWLKNEYKIDIIELYHTVNRLRSFLSSCHHVILWSCHQVIMSLFLHFQCFHELTDNFQVCFADNDVLKINLQHDSPHHHIHLFMFVNQLWLNEVDVQCPARRVSGCGCNADPRCSHPLIITAVLTSWSQSTAPPPTQYSPIQHSSVWWWTLVRGHLETIPHA